jgi:hypothetical protein
MPDRSDRGDSFSRAYGAGWVGDSRLPVRGRVILTKNGVAVVAGWVIQVRFGLGRRLKPTLLKNDVAIKASGVIGLCFGLAHRQG